MPAKFDKEMLKKHHFWFSFILIGIGLLLAWIGLFSEVADSISGTEGKNNSAKDQLKTVQAKSRKLVDAYDEQVKQLGIQRVKMWKESWDEQKALFVWPAGYAADQFASLMDLKFGDEISEKPLAVRSQFRARKIYEAEYRNLIDTLKPMQFKDNNWQKVLRYVELFPLEPEGEDMWLAMEDLWVQRDILLAIHKVNADAAKFDIVKGKEPGKDDGYGPKHRLFQSRNWELDLELAKNDNQRLLRGTLKNRSDRLQVMGVGNTMILKVWLSPEAKRPYEFEVQGTSVEADRGRYRLSKTALTALRAEKLPNGILDKLQNILGKDEEAEFDSQAEFLGALAKQMPNKTEFDNSQKAILDHTEIGKIVIKTIKSHTLPTDLTDQKASELFRVEQQFDVRTVPVKRIDVMALGKLSDRNSQLPLKMSKFSQALAEKEQKEGGSETSPSGFGTGAPKGSPMSPGGPGSPGGSDTAELPDKSQNMLERSRYIDVTDQVRRLPLGVDIITDQAYTKDIIEAIVNVKLRFQMTQVHWSRFHDTLNYGTPPATAGNPMVGTGMGALLSNPYGGGPSFTPNNNREDQFSANLMELSIYGILSLYEKFPGEKTDAKQPVPKTTKVDKK